MLQMSYEEHLNMKNRFKFYKP